MKKHPFLLCVAMLLMVHGSRLSSIVHHPSSIVHHTSSISHQTSDIRQFRRVDTSGNLSGDYVRSIIRDRYGAIWLLMMNHVERYDGHRFHHYELNGMPQGGDALHDIVLTADGRLWITGTEHIYIYHEREDCIRRADDADFAPYGFVPGTVSAIFTDRRQDLWCHAAGTSPLLYHYNFATRRLTQTDVGRTGAVIGLTLVHDKAYMLTATHGDSCALWTIGQGRQTPTPVARIPIAPTERTRLYADSRGRIWLYALNDTMLWQYDTRTDICTDATPLFPTDGIMMTALIDDGDGNLWMGTGNHGICMTDGTGHFVPLRQDAGAPFQLSDNHINCFYLDVETATMWVGTSKQGLVYSGPLLTSVSIRHMPAAEDVSCLDTDSDGVLWMGFDSQGAASVTEGAPFSRLTIRDGGLSSNQIVCTLRDSQGRRWWGSYGGELLYMDAQGRPHRIHDRRLHQVISLQEDDEGRIWVGTFYDGVYALDPTTASVTRAFTPHDGTLRSGCVSQLLWDSRRRHLYMATNDGLYALDVATGNLRRYMDGTDIRAILLMPDGQTLWVGLDTGLTVLDPTSGDVLATLTTRDGLSHNTIFALVADSHGSVWASTKHGVSRITPSPAGYRCTAFADAEGLGDICFNPHAVTRLADGTILMGALGAVVSIVPREADAVLPSPGSKTFFTALFLGDEYVQVGTPLSDGRTLLSQNLLMTNRIDLSHHDTSVSIEVSDMNCLMPGQRYQYRLGREGAWHDMEGYTIVLNDLRPGSYLLQARTAGTSDTDAIASLAIRVASPWYLTRLAVAIYILLATALTALLLRRRQLQLRRQAAAQQHEMAIRQQQQTDEAKMRFFTNVSHDMRTPLSLIVTPLQRLLQRDTLDEEVRSQLELMRHSADTLQEEIAQLLDYRRLDQTPGTLSLSDGSLREFVQTVCQPFVEADLQGGVTLGVTLPEVGDMMTRFDHAKVKRIITNLISNAIKYNKPGGHVEVTLSRDADDAVISVSDQGKGIRPENRERIFERFFQEPHDNRATYTGSGIGLHLVKQYVLMMGGNVSVAPAEPEGSVFTVRLPLAEVTNENLPPKESGIIPADGSPAQPTPDSSSFIPDYGQSPEGQETKTLLIVEDNDDFRSFLQSCLAEHYRTLTAANGEEALRLLAEHDVQLIVSDVMMPVMDGMELCRRVKNDLRISHIPFIMLTARATDEAQADGLHEGADDYITKPFNLDILLLRIGRLLRWAEDARKRFQQADVHPAELTVSPVDQRLIEQAIAQVEAHMADPDYSVEQLGSALAMSRSGLYKKLMAITGLSPLLFIRTLRIKRGRQLLEQSGESVSQVAYRIGLSPKQFAKYFREAYGQLPSEFLKA